MHNVNVYSLIWYTCSYNDVDDEHRGTNILITADESFNSIESRKITVILISNNNNNNMYI